MSYFQIAIDGPAGSGKSTVAKAIAQQLGFVYLSTGRFYRAFAYLMTKHNWSVAQLLNHIKTIKLVVNGDQVLINDVDVSAQMGLETTAHTASQIATDPQIRALAVKLQQAYAKHDSIVMDGRDIATVVLPNAQLKIFLTASAQVRAQRRAHELGLAQQQIAALTQEIAQRDALDATRKINPLIIHPDAVVIDSSAMTINAVVNKIIHLYEQVIAAA